MTVQCRDIVRRSGTALSARSWGSQCPYSATSAIWVRSWRHGCDASISAFDFQTLSYVAKSRSWRSGR